MLLSLDAWMIYCGEVSQHVMNLLRQPCGEELSPPVNSQLHSACQLC